MKKKEKFFDNNKSGFETTMISYSGYGYGKHCAGMTNIYGYTPDGFVFNYIVTYHRSLVILKMLRSGEWWNVDKNIRINYSENDCTTRVGILKANLRNKQFPPFSYNLLYTINNK